MNGNLWMHACMFVCLCVCMCVRTCVCSLLSICNSSCKVAVLFKIQVSRLLSRYVSVVLRWCPEICILSYCPKWVIWSNLFRKLILESRSSTNWKFTVHFLAQSSLGLQGWPFLSYTYKIGFISDIIIHTNLNTKRQDCGPWGPEARKASRTTQRWCLGKKNNKTTKTR